MRPTVPCVGRATAGLIRRFKYMCSGSRSGCGVDSGAINHASSRVFEQEGALDKATPCWFTQHSLTALLRGVQACGANQEAGGGRSGTAAACSGRRRRRASQPEH
ncbi:unnamed protein product [Natator depressus]